MSMYSSDKKPPMSSQTKILMIIAGITVAVVGIIIIIVSLSGFGIGKVKTDEPETVTATEAVTEAAEGPIEKPEGVEIEIPISELAAQIDKAEDDYKSFEILPIDNADFFLGKTLRMAASIENHEMTNVYASNITAKFERNYLEMHYPDADGNTQDAANYVYKVSEEPFTTNGGRKFIVMAFGDHELTEENKEFSTDCFVLIKMADKVDMGEASADTYVMMIESAFPDRYEIFKVEG